MIILTQYQPFYINCFLKIVNSPHPSRNGPIFLLSAYDVILAARLNLGIAAYLSTNRLNYSCMAGGVAIDFRSFPTQSQSSKMENNCSSDPEPSGSKSVPGKSNQISEVQDQVEQMREIMTDKFQKVQDRSIKLEELDETTYHLKEEAVQLQESARKLRWRMELRNYKLKILVIIVCVVLLIVSTGIFIFCL